MEKNLSLWQWIGFTFAVVLGSLLHFLFDWTGSYALAPFSAVNESTWEHMKILFFPLLVFALIQRPFANDYPAFWWIKCIGILAGVISIPVLFYTYNGAFGKSPDWLNITFFILATSTSYVVEFLLFRQKNTCKFCAWYFIILCAIAFTFVIFTFFPPKLPLFQAPITKLYGAI